MQIFGAAALIFILWLIVNLAMTSATASAVVALGAQATTALRAVQIASFVAQAVFGAFNAVLVGVFYYQLRVAKDGVDVDKIASVFD